MKAEIAVNDDNSVCGSIELDLSASFQSSLVSTTYTLCSPEHYQKRSAQLGLMISETTAFTLVLTSAAVTTPTKRGGQN